MRKVLAALVPPMLERARVEGAAQCERLAAEALASADALLDAELRRIEALARVNPSVRLDEIARLREERDRLRELLPLARPRLDALRLVASPDFLSLRKS
jgi:ATP-dependent helicase HepA